MKLEGKLGLKDALAVIVVLLCLSSSLGSSQATDPSKVEGYYGLNLKGKRKLILTFDDGPGTLDFNCEERIRDAYAGYSFSKSTTENLITVLENFGPKLSPSGKIPATFFFRGDNFTRYPDVAKIVSKKGYSLGNHSFNHRNSLSFPTNEALLLDFMRVDKSIETSGYAKFARGKNNETFFRPPYGSWSNRLTGLFRSNEKLKQYSEPIFWNIDSKDFLLGNRCEVRMIASYLKNFTMEMQGGVILMHDVFAVAPAALHLFLNWLVEENERVRSADGRIGSVWEIISLEEGYYQHIQNLKEKNKQ